MFILNIPNLHRLKLDFFPTALTAQTAQKLQSPVSFHITYIYDKHNINLVVLIFFKTYVCKHESKRERKHIEQKNWPIVLANIWHQNQSWGYLHKKVGIF